MTVLGEVGTKHIRLNEEMKTWIETRVHDWAKNHSDEGVSGQLYYSVNLRRTTGHSQRFQCELQILGRTALWSSRGSAATPKQAFIRCLAAAHPTATTRPS